MSQIVQVQSGKTQVRLPDLVMYGSLEKALLTDNQFDGLSVDAFTAYLTDLGPGILTKAIALDIIVDDGQTVASFTPGFRGAVRSFCAVVSTVVSTGSRSCALGVKIDNAKGTNEVQTLAKTGTVSGGTYDLAFMGQTAAGIAVTANAATIQTAIDALSNVQPGDIVVTGGSVNTTPVVFTFAGQYAGQDVAAITVDGASATGGGTLAITETTKGVQGDSSPTVLAGGVLTLTSALCTPVGKVISATNVKGTAAGPAWFLPDSRIDIYTTGNPTDFAEGAVVLMLMLEPSPGVNYEQDSI